MKNRGDSDFALRKRDSSALFCEGSDPDHEPGSQRLDDPVQCPVAALEEGSPLSGRQPVGRSVPAARLEEHQWAVVPYREAGEEALRRLETFPRPAPESSAAHLAARAGDAQNGAPRVFGGGSFDWGHDSEPVPNVRDLAEGDAGLRHPPRPRVHSEPECLDAGPREASQVDLVGPARVEQRVVDVRDRSAERQTLDLVREVSTDAHRSSGASQAHSSRAAGSASPRAPIHGPYHGGRLDLVGEADLW